MANELTNAKKLLKGFTLAEVLTTLGIIGVIAALTIPNVINNSRNKELESKFKKSYSILSEAVKLMKIDEGNVWQNYIYQNTGSINGFYNAFIKYFKVAKDCGVGGCVSSDTAYATYDGHAAIPL